MKALQAGKCDKMRKWSPDERDAVFLEELNHRGAIRYITEWMNAVMQHRKLAKTLIYITSKQKPFLGQLFYLVFRQPRRDDATAFLLFR